ncbi:hypothetical protein [Streptomyces sp. TRM68367]|uniref:hypothetical protein n=1 Tax=Streptomyces sp. TRM68367 TaxID=2758415 RepID=UPI00165AE361|nr:hypothetical protein [Streptomyces sp. TRM68367]MBC9728037.1 hypothetical protein [Streptomyces sp. TRM68367]
MTVTLDRPARTRTRDSKELLNAVQPHIKHLTINVLDSGMPSGTARSPCCCATTPRGRGGHDPSARPEVDRP